MNCEDNKNKLKSPNKFVWLWIAYIYIQVYISFLEKVGFDLKTFVCKTIFYTLGCIEKLFIRDYSRLYDIYIEVKSQRPVLMYWTKEKIRYLICLIG